MTYEFVPTEELDEYDDDGTMLHNVATLANNVVGHRIVDVAVRDYESDWYKSNQRLEITLDNGKKVTLANTDDCCAYTELNSFLWNADKIDHVITGVKTEDGYTKWSIFADMGDVLTMHVGWSCGNPFYYGYGFDIEVVDSDGSTP